MLYIQLQIFANGSNGDASNIRNLCKMNVECEGPEAKKLWRKDKKRSLPNIFVPSCIDKPNPHSKWILKGKVVKTPFRQVEHTLFASITPLYQEVGDFQTQGEFSNPCSS